MSGLNRDTGRLVTGWEHVKQSIAVLLTTPLKSRAMRRPYGSELPRLVDQPMSPVTVVRFYAAVAGAINTWEPRFRIKRMRLTDATSDGQITMKVEGVYFPRGHLGDYSVQQPADVTVPL